MQPPDHRSPVDPFDTNAARERVAHARLVAGRMMWLGWFVLVVGVLAIGTVAVLWAVGEVGFDEAVTEVSALLLGTVLTGVATYGTALNLLINADRLELALPG
jgi:hypothetical protein